MFWILCQVLLIYHLIFANTFKIPKGICYKVADQWVVYTLIKAGHPSVSAVNAVTSWLYLDYYTEKNGLNAPWSAHAAGCRRASKSSEQPGLKSATRIRGTERRRRRKRSSTDLNLLQKELRWSSGRCWQWELHGALTRHRQVLHQIGILTHVVPCTS